MSNETVDVGGQALKELDDQGSRLTRIEEGKIQILSFVLKFVIFI